MEIFRWVDDLFGWIFKSLFGRVGIIRRIIAWGIIAFIIIVALRSRG